MYDVHYGGNGSRRNIVTVLDIEEGIKGEDELISLLLAGVLTCLIVSSPCLVICSV